MVKVFAVTLKECQKVTDFQFGTFGKTFAREGASTSEFYRLHPI
jgi:hypothetical protein